MLAAVDSHFGERCRIGIGVNSGLVLVGTIGAGDVVELGVVGDPVNVAARVQDATRELGEPLLRDRGHPLPAGDEAPELEHARLAWSSGGRTRRWRFTRSGFRNGIRTPAAYNRVMEIDKGETP